MSNEEREFITCNSLIKNSLADMCIELVGGTK